MKEIKLDLPVVEPSFILQTCSYKIIFTAWGYNTSIRIEERDIHKENEPSKLVFRGNLNPYQVATLHAILHQVQSIRQLGER